MRAEKRTYRETPRSEEKEAQSDDFHPDYRIPLRPIGLPRYGDIRADGLQQKRIAAGL
jgi:hypothetical protein